MALSERSRLRRLPRRQPQLARRGFELLTHINAAPSVNTAVHAALTRLGRLLRAEHCALLLADDADPGAAQLPAMGRLVAPICVEGEPVAHICVEAPESRAWSAAEAALVEAVGVALGRTFERERGAQRTRADHAVARYGATSVLIASLDLPTTLRSVADHAALMTGAMLAQLFLLEPESAGLRLVAESGQHGRSAAGATLDLPLEQDGRALGLLRLTHPLPGGQFAAQSVSALRQFVQFAATAIGNAQLHSAVQEANRLKSEFIATVSHELRTPMGAIMGYAELLTSGSYGALPDAMRDPLQRLKANADGLLLLINQMLDLSRIEAGRLELHAEPFQPSDLLHAVVAQSLAGHPVELRHEIDAAVPRIVLGDVRRLRQMLDYLLAYRLKQIDRGALLIRCTAEEDAGPAQLVLEISDTGPAIPIERLAVIWQPFPQHGGVDAPAAGGAGLDLPLVQRLAQLMDGSISVVSAATDGTRFTLRLPLRRP